MGSPLVILGCGFTGLEVARRGAAAASSIVATTQNTARRAELARMSVTVREAPALTARLIADLVSSEASVLVAFPPDGHTDAAIAPVLARVRRIVYLSTTGVYGEARGRVDESTPVDPSEPRAALRLAAERLYLDRGATVLRAAGIYGSGRGLHRRLQDGTFRIPGDGSNVVSRVHVGDLARAALALFAVPTAEHQARVFVVADDTPVPQIEVIRWLCDRLGLPRPRAASIDEVPPTLRHDRSVDNGLLKRSLSFAFAFPSYREGFEACLASEGFSPAG